MASPQTQNGYARLANELVEALYRFPFSGCELRVVVWVIRHSYGWARKDTPKIMLIDASKDLHMPDASTSRVLIGLHGRGVLIRVEGGGWRLNKNYEEWLPTDSNQLGLIGGKNTVRPAPPAPEPRARRATAAPKQNQTHSPHCGRCGSIASELRQDKRRDGTPTYVCTPSCSYAGSTQLTRAAMPESTRKLDAERRERFMAAHRAKMAAKERK